ncbi:hypothetical protein HYV70_04020 [Candidatus Uhrbacteria bacterium]|nr:hypothetical protein [Candidatus Uhrbacteria bacterium]
MELRVPREGHIYRDSDGSVVVTVQGDKRHKIEQLRNLQCLTPDYEPRLQIWERRFFTRRLYLPGEYEAARAHLYPSPETLVLAANGYTDFVQAPGTPSQQEYVDWSQEMIEGLILTLRQKVPNMGISLVQGSILQGIDQAIIQAGLRLEVPMLGFSCPSWMFGFDDDEEAFPIFVGKDPQEYSRFFAHDPDVLLTFNGSDQCFREAVRMLERGKLVFPVDILDLISRGNGPASFNPDGGMTNASRVLNRLVRLEDRPFSTNCQNRQDRLKKWIDRVATSILTR